jgi:uncharacterized protein YbcI
MPESHVSSVNEQISRGAVKLTRAYTGRGPTKAHTEVNTDTIAIVLADNLTKEERNLAASGEDKPVPKARHSGQEAMREDLIALVEKHSGRTVAAMLSANHIDPDVALEFFLLRPLPGDEALAIGGQADSSP